MPSICLKLANALHLTANLDKICRENAIRHGAKQQIHNKLFINFMTDAICTPEVCLEATIQMVISCGLQAHQLVLEAVKADQLDSTSHLRQIITHLKNHQICSALDDVGDQIKPFEIYHKLDPSYLIMDMRITRNIHQNELNQAILDHLLLYKQKYGATLIAKGIEREEEFVYLRSQGVDYLQGNYFGKPELNLL